MPTFDIPYEQQGYVDPIENGCHTEDEHNNYCTFSLSNKHIKLTKTNSVIKISLHDIGIIKNNFKPENRLVYSAIT